MPLVTANEFEHLEPTDLLDLQRTFAPSSSYLTCPLRTILLEPETMFS
jgi:hypothetical protein